MFSKRMRRLRKGRGLNQKELATEIGVSVDSVRRWERGQRSPDVETLCKMAEVLKTTVSYLSGETDDEFPLVKSQPVERVPTRNESMSTKMDDTSFIERLVKSTSMVVYDTGNERMLIPATKEGFDFIERMRSGRRTEEKEE